MFKELLFVFAVKCYSWIQLALSIWENGQVTVVFYVGHHGHSILTERYFLPWWHSYAVAWWYSKGQCLLDMLAQALHEVQAHSSLAKCNHREAIFIVFESAVGINVFPIPSILSLVSIIILRGLNFLAGKISGTFACASSTLSTCRHLVGWPSSNPWRLLHQTFQLVLLEQVLRMDQL